MEIVYFIYSHDTKRDSEIVKNLHYWAPLNIDIIESKIKDGQIVDLYGDKNREMPNCLINLRRPIYLAEDALDELMSVEKYNLFIGFSSNAHALEFLKFRGRDTAGLVNKLASERRIIGGERNINDYISELKHGGRFIF